MIVDKVRWLSNRGIALGNTIKLTSIDIVNVEKSLNISIPQDFKSLCVNCSHETFYLFEFLNFGHQEGVISETLGLRKECNLPHNYLVLAMNDAGPILMKINSADNSEVIMCSYYDFDNICQGKPYEENPTIFPTFTDFYEFLLEEEEKSRADDKLAKS